MSLPSWSAKQFIAISAFLSKTSFSGLLPFSPNSRLFARGFEGVPACTERRQTRGRRDSFARTSIGFDRGCLTRSRRARTAPTRYYGCTEPRRLGQRCQVSILDKFLFRPRNPTRTSSKLSERDCNRLADSVHPCDSFLISFPSFKLKLADLRNTTTTATLLLPCPLATLASAYVHYLQLA